MMRRSWVGLAILLLALAPPVYTQDNNAQTNESPPGSSAPAAFDTYVIQSGDTLFKIAEEFNTTVDALMAANTVAIDGRIIAGQVLLIPAADDRSDGVYAVQAGDTLLSIAARFNTSVGILQELNGLGDTADIAAGQSLVVPSIDESGYQAYIVQVDDSLFSISRRFHTSVSFLMSLNGIADARELEKGRAILVPAIDETRFEAYEIQPEDSLSSIARRFGTSEDSLISLNGMADRLDIEAGQTILAPRFDDTAYTVHVVQSGDTLFEISRLFHTTVAQLRSLNGIEGGAGLKVGRGIIVPKVDETLLERYIVQPGDSLYSIARRYDIDLPVLQALNRLADARDLKVDQAILVPKLDGPRLAMHVIGLGDTLEQIAEQYETTVETLQSLNGIADPSLIVLDQAILAPEPAVARVRPGFGFGIHVFVDGARAGELAIAANRIGVDWVKIDVSWAEIETAPDIYSYSALDSMVAAMELAGLQILLNVYDAPNWSREAYTETLNRQFREHTGPPAEYDDLADFLTNLVTRYAGLVDAYEIWKSPNLVKYWTAPVYTRPQETTADGDFGIPDEIRLGARFYVPLLEIAYDTIKAIDEGALVISAGLAPVGFNDNYNSIDTVTFLNNMLLAGAAEHSDAIGAIFSASAAPPTLQCCDAPPGVDTHFESFLQYYIDLLAFYDETLREHGLELPIIVTQLGWGTVDGANLAVPAAGFEWLNYTSEDEQALYVTQAYQIAQDLDNVDAIFLYNLNGCAAGDAEACFFSLEDAAGRERPVYAAYQAVPKSGDAA